MQEKITRYSGFCILKDSIYLFILYNNSKFPRELRLNWVFPYVFFFVRDHRPCSWPGNVKRMKWRKICPLHPQKYDQAAGQLNSIFAQIWRRRWLGFTSLNGWWDRKLRAHPVTTRALSKHLHERWAQPTRYRTFEFQTSQNQGLELHGPRCSLLTWSLAFTLHCEGKVWTE